MRASASDGALRKDGRAGFQACGTLSALKGEKPGGGGGQRSPLLPPHPLNL